MNFCAGLAVLCFLIDSCLVTESEGINCYNCGGCNDPFESSGVDTIKCNGSCTKIASSIGVARECASSKVDTFCMKGSVDGISGESCACNSDLCNSSSIQKLSVSVAVMMFAWRYMVKFAL